MSWAQSEGREVVVRHRTAWMVVGGWACLWSWPYAAFMMPSLGIAPVGGFSVETLLWIVSMAALCATIVAMTACERRVEPLLSSLPPAVACTAALALSCMAVAVGRAGALPLGVGVAGSVVSGASSGYLLVAWQKLLSTLSWNEVEAGIPLGYGASLALGVACAAAGALVGTVLAACLVGVSALGFAAGVRTPLEPECTPEPPARGSSGTSWTCVALCVGLLMVPLGFVEDAVTPARDATSPAFMVAILVGAALAGLMSYAAYRHAARIDLALVIRTTAPLATGALVILCFAPDWMAAAQVLGFAANTVIHIYLSVTSAAMIKAGLGSACRSSTAYLMPLYLGTVVSVLVTPALAGLGVARASLLLVAGLMLMAMFLAPCAGGYGPAGSAEPAGPCATEPSAPTEAQTAAPTPAAQAALVFAERYGLTKREREVLEPFVAGRDSGWIREHLGISRDTVNTHLKHIYTKMGIHSKRELIDLVEQLAVQG